MKSLQKIDSETDFRFWGGDHMIKVGGHCVKHIEDLAFMGFIEVVMNIRTISKNLKLCRKDVLNYKPDVLVLVDYPGFNLRIAEFAKQHNIKVHYYISPQVWAWKQNRVHKIKRVVDEMYCILPFEKAFYKKFDIDVNFVGHPLVDAIANFRKLALSKNDFIEKHQFNDKPILAVLPGSRNQEIKVKLPIMLEALKDFSNYQIVIAGAPNKSTSFYNAIIGNSDIKIIENDTYNLLNHSDLAVVTSGTATLETALFQVPQVVCYKASSISYQIAKRLIKTKYISLVNLIMDKEVVTELIQNDLTAKNIKVELNKISEHNSVGRNEMLNHYKLLIESLGGGGASDEVARLMFDKLSNE